MAESTANAVKLPEAVVVPVVAETDIGTLTTDAPAVNQSIMPVFAASAKLVIVVESY